ncbi:MAG TPA: hypothetical protein VKM56_04640, partial [Verrucomicrobiae bacterium]|nr:hypothetical protein [Verrucomicrobiae bacterium]
MKAIITASVLTVSILAFGCKQAPTQPAARVQTVANRQGDDVPSALPDNAFKAEIRLLDPPA